MAEIIMGKTANEVWRKAVGMLLEQKETQAGRTGEVFELLHTFISIEEPRQRWVFDRMPPMSISFALAELVWIVNGEERSDVINFWNPKLPSFAGEGPVYYGAYGKRIRSHFGFDQLDAVYNALQNVPESRQVAIQIYDVVKDFPIENGQPRDKDIPCNICSLLKVRDGRLEWSQIMRSNDVLLGMPYNFIQFTGLQEILAGWLGLEMGSYNHYSDSLHLYDRDISKIGIGHESEISNRDSLLLCRGESEKIFKEIYDRMISLATEKITEKDIYSLAVLDSQYVAYNNMMLLISAYVASKMCKFDLVNELISKCTNELYVAMWNRWISNKKIDS